MFSKLKMDKALFDLETWPYSGKESEVPNYWIEQALQLAHKHNIKLMITVGGGLASCYSCWATAASNGAYKVSVQSQAASTLAGFKKRVESALKAVGNKSLLVVGLATNTPGVKALSLLRDEYAWARSDGLDQFWLNANNWLNRNKCGRSQGGRGCPQIGVQFLASP
jgi:imidazole glycerol phosphate synthase subunit HisF